MTTEINREERLAIAIKSMKRQLTRTLRDNVNSHAISFPKGIRYVSTNDEDSDSKAVFAFLKDIRPFLSDDGQKSVDNVLNHGMEVNKDIRQKFAELALNETFRVDDAADAMPYEGADRFLNRLYEVICKHNEYKHDSTEYKLWKLTNEGSDKLTVPSLWEKTKLTLTDTNDKTIPYSRPTIVILPGLTTSDPAIIGTEDDESVPLASVIMRHVAMSGVNFGNAKNPEHNTDIVFMTHGNDYAKLQSWLDITKHNEDIKAGKEGAEIYVTPRITAFVEQSLRPLYFSQNKKLDKEQIRKNFSKLMFVGYSAGTSASSMISLALNRDMKTLGFTPAEIEATLPHLHVLNIASVNNPIALPAAPTTLSIQNEHDRYANISEFQNSFPTSENGKDIRAVLKDNYQLLLQPQDPGDCYPSYIISDDSKTRKMRYRVDEERHNAPSLLSRPIIQVNGEGAEIRPPIENPGSLMSHHFIGDWHDRAVDTQPAKKPPEEILLYIKDEAHKFKRNWLEKLRKAHLPKSGEATEPSPGL